MVSKYNKEEINNKWKMVNQGYPELIYKNGKELFNYTGKLNDEPKIPLMEYISKLILDDFYILKKIGKNPQNLRDLKPFKTRLGISDSSRMLDKYGHIRCDENKFGIALFNSDYEFQFGKIKNYQLSLKEFDGEGPGPIDLISCKNNEIFVIELKTRQSNKETLLRAIMEAYTFVVLLNIKKDKFIKDLNLSIKFSFRPAILTFSDIQSGEDMNKLQVGDFPNLIALIFKMNKYFANLGIMPFKFFAFKPLIPELITDKKGRIVFKNQKFPITSKVLEFYPPEMNLNRNGKNY